MRRIITLDGPAGVGKSTIAKRVAEHCGIAYLDTGAMFRIIAKTLGPENVALPEEALAKKLGALVFSLAGSGAATTLACNGVVAGQEIRTEAVGKLASDYAVLPAVRAYLKTAQQELGKAYSLVAEGRDMGTAVFPGAPYKFFLDASPEVRARRRVGQLAENGVIEDVATVARQIRERDEQDRNRPIAPLRPADDAVIIDTSERNIDQVFQAIIDTIEK
ncbi:Cytidylate kinase [uncultured delta proteobacterium]|uniref:Cytidylate kinase n=1 Tax=uncultured delta proteobacterium TaxID=34034 RepID=A0A212JIW7_9DELT|nr:Cytidylate kinase [uncultured delta proteobacterium]